MFLPAKTAHTISNGSPCDKSLKLNEEIQSLLAEEEDAQDEAAHTVTPLLVLGTLRHQEQPQQLELDVWKLTGWRRP